METILKTVKREFDQLDMFRKMYARRDFQRKSGMSIEDWLATISELIPELEILAQAAENDEANQVRAKLTWLESNLESLANYFKKTKEAAQGFIKDPKALSTALEALDYREETVRSLVSEFADLLNHPVRG